MTPSTTTTAALSTHRPSWRSWALYSMLPAWLLLFVLAPTLILAVRSLFPLATDAQMGHSLTWQNYREAFDPVYLRVYWRSAWCAGLTTILCAVFGYPVAYYIGRSPAGRRNRLLLAVMIPFLTSFLIRTFAWTLILDQYGVLNTFLRAIHVIPALFGENFEVLRSMEAVIIVLVYTYLPFMILPIYASVEKLDPSLIEAASDLGAGPARTFWRVTLPLTLPGVRTGVLMVFVPAVAMFAVTDVMSGGKIHLIGDVIHELFMGGQNPALGSAMGMILLIAFGASYYLFSRRTGPAALA